MRIICWIPVLLGCLVGCSANTSPPQAGSDDVMRSGDGASAHEAMIEITPAARKRILGVVKANSIDDRWCLRVSVKPGGCTGIIESIDLDPSGAGPGDVEMRVGDIRCVFARSEESLIQGVLIDWNENDIKAGFKMTYPNRTKENQDRAAKINSEALKDDSSP